MYIKALFATACLAVIVLCGVFITRQIGFESDQPAGWGDVLTLISIISAGFIAACTLLYANHQVTKERQRIAHAQAKIIYETIAPISRIAITSFAVGLSNIDAINFTNFCEFDPNNEKQLNARRDWFIYHCNSQLALTPQVPNLLGELPVLYHHSTELGDAALSACKLVIQIRKDLEGFTKKSRETQVADYQESPESEKRDFCKLIVNFADAPLKIEELRQNIPGVKFHPNFSPAIWKGFKVYLKSTLEINYTSADLETDNKAFVMMFEEIKQHFAIKMKRHQTAATQLWHADN